MKLSSYFSFKVLPKIIINIYISILILLFVTTLVSHFKGIPIEFFTRDPAVTITSEIIIPLIDDNYNPFVGIISQIGVLFWCISASLSLFCSLLIEQSRQIIANFLRFFGLFTSLLLVDDLFLLHESIFPSLFKISEKSIYCTYIIICFLGLIKFRRVVFKTQWTILILSLIFFFISMTIDMISIFSYSVGLRIVLEDGFKLLGIVSWCCYFGLVCWRTTKILLYSENKLS